MAGSIIFGLVLATLAAGFKGMLAVIGEIALLAALAFLPIFLPEAWRLASHSCDSADRPEHAFRGIRLGSASCFSLGFTYGARGWEFRLEIIREAVCDLAFSIRPSIAYCKEAASHEAFRTRWTAYDKM